jgi:hypothetical protein
MTGRVWSFVLSGPAFSANSRYHWAERNRRTQEWRESAGWTAKQKRIPHLDRARIDVEWCVSDRRRRDASNAQTAVKACVDGIVDAGVLDDDDDTRLDGPTVRTVHVGGKAVRGLWTLNVIVTEVTA